MQVNRILKLISVGLTGANLTYAEQSIGGSLVQVSTCFNSPLLLSRLTFRSLHLDIFSMVTRFKNAANVNASAVGDNESWEPNRHELSLLL